MGQVRLDIPPPANWQDFELIAHDVYKFLWQDDYAERFGRLGQSQDGVDIIGFDFRNRERVAVQCKRKKFRSEIRPAETLTTAEVDKEIANVKESKLQFQRYIIATTGPRDAKIQTHIQGLNSTGLAFKVVSWFWDDFAETINNSLDLLYRHYGDILKHRNQYSETEHYFRLLRMAFDRPAFRTAMHSESRVLDFIQAISQTQSALSTGRLEDRNGRLIDQVRLPANLPNREIAEIQDLLQDVRDIATRAYASKIIVQHPTVIEIKDRTISDSLNLKRGNTIKILNSLLSSNNIPELHWKEY